MLYPRHLEYSRWVCVPDRSNNCLLDYFYLWNIRHVIHSIFIIYYGEIIYLPVWNNIKVTYLYLSLKEKPWLGREKTHLFLVLPVLITVNWVVIKEHSLTTQSKLAAEMLDRSMMFLKEQKLRTSVLASWLLPLSYHPPLCPCKFLLKIFQNGWNFTLSAKLLSEYYFCFQNRRSFNKSQLLVAFSQSHLSKPLRP